MHPSGEWPTADVLVPAWRPSTAVRLPLEQITTGTGLEGGQLVGRWLEADVNCHAEEPRDLFFLNFSLAPDLPGDWL